MNKCAWPTCCSEATNGIHCFQHNRIYGTKETAKVKQVLSLPELIEKAQKVFNTWIRDRDRGKGCFTCGSSGTECGHFVPVGENEALRFTEENAHLQCHICNVFKTGNREIYRAVMIQKYGLDKVIELETYPRFHKFSRTQLENIISHYSPSKITLNNS